MPFSGIRTRNLSKLAAADTRLDRAANGICSHLRVMYVCCIIYWACSTTLGCTTWRIPNYVHSFPKCLFIPGYWALCCRTSKSIDSTNAVDSFWYLNMRPCLLAGHVPNCCFRTSRWGLVFTRLNIRWSLFWYSWSQLHVVSSLRWNRCRYAFVIPCPVSIADLYFGS